MFGEKTLGTRHVNSHHESEELMDTSDECDQLNSVNTQFVTDNGAPAQEKDPDEEANEIIRDSERMKPRMFNVPGKVNTNDIFLMDTDYQMMDAHIDEGMRKCILNYEYIDLAKLLPRNHSREQEQRLEIVNRNGMTYLSPISDCEAIQIGSYHKWEQAFRIYSNILATCFPEKATELLQYTHTIQTASMAYNWNNVYEYDKEFCYHISRHPQRSWNVILQQAWTMILKDRIRSDQGPQKGGNGDKVNKRDREPCRRFNRGKCTFGLSCHFDHCCSVPECGKFGHSAHVCRLCKNANQSPTDQQRTPNRDRK